MQGHLFLYGAGNAASVPGGLYIDKLLIRHIIEGKAWSIGPF
jgi:hypothetical protein